MGYGDMTTMKECAVDVRNTQEKECTSALRNLENGSDTPFHTARVIVSIVHVLGSISVTLATLLDEYRRVNKWRDKRPSQG